MNTNSETKNEVSAVQETKAFLLISVLAIPLLTVLGIAGYGFVVWMMQLLMGPPGHF
ncbi:periplasmic nitrate reductase, NapE protein [Motiliproteus sp.]|uniref:periplasmic nitrate reductase, NapE protein n=1 Tax=Motiliproteus sp. TaxID=1898955 RepID=UPI003BA9F81B